MSDLQQLYQQIILDHAKARHGAVDELEPLPEPAEGVRVAQSHQINTTCGDEVTLRLAVADERVDAVTWAGAGCSISMASASVLHDTLSGLGLDEARALLEVFRELLRSRGKIEGDEEVLGDAAAFSGVSRYPARVKCAMLPWVAFEAALVAAESA